LLAEVGHGENEVSQVIEDEARNCDDDPDFDGKDRPGRALLGLEAEYEVEPSGQKC